MRRTSRELSIPESSPSLSGPWSGPVHGAQVTGTQVTRPMMPPLLPVRTGNDIMSDRSLARETEREGVSPLRRELWWLSLSLSLLLTHPILPAQLLLHSCVATHDCSWGTHPVVHHRTAGRDSPRPLVPHPSFMLPATTHLRETYLCFLISHLLG